MNIKLNKYVYNIYNEIYLIKHNSSDIYIINIISIWSEICTTRRYQNGNLICSKPVFLSIFKKTRFLYRILDFTFYRYFPDIFMRAWQGMSKPAGLQKCQKRPKLPHCLFQPWRLLPSLFLELTDSLNLASASHCSWRATDGKFIPSTVS